MPSAAPATTLLEWFDTLTDEEQEGVLRLLRDYAARLGVRVDRKSLTAHNLLDLTPHVTTMISLN